MSTNTGSQAPQQDAAAAAAAGGGGAEKDPQQADTVTKTVQTVEVRSSAGQPDEEGVLNPVRVVHEIPTKDAKENPGVKQD
ncbi:uncharacterized protein C2845_PM04G10850 [Panicum miliaceum]|uniref:Uncharacterized protein n=1 Tax=Panicum miliaceum TaxID=4540 RepID=A0A3L6QUY7_PANMI|nr:uncharacterized protein C2845_PM04G10850 [Panicum miliaceum]